MRCSARARGWCAPSSFWAAASCTRAGHRRGARGWRPPDAPVMAGPEKSPPTWRWCASHVVLGDLAPHVRVVAVRDSGANAAQRPGDGAQGSEPAVARLSAVLDGAGGNARTDRRLPKAAAATVPLLRTPRSGMIATDHG